jgi:hypothetical protein
MRLRELMKRVEELSSGGSPGLAHDRMVELPLDPVLPSDGTPLVIVPSATPCFVTARVEAINGATDIDVQNTMIYASVLPNGEDQEAFTWASEVVLATLYRPFLTRLDASSGQYFSDPQMITFVVPSDATYMFHSPAGGATGQVEIVLETPLG